MCKACESGSALHLRFFEHVTTKENQKEQKECENQHRINLFLVERYVSIGLYFKNGASPILVCLNGHF